MKLILFLISLVYLINAEANNFSNSSNSSYSVHLPTGKWVESASESEIHRSWDGTKWVWSSEPNKSIHQIKDKKLISVREPGKSEITYEYNKKNHIEKISHGKGQFLKIVYDEKDRVIEQWAPLGKDETPILMDRFIYKDHQTEHYDALNNKKIYHWNDHQEITRVDYFLENSLYKSEFISWSAPSGSSQNVVTEYRLESASGKILLKKENSYDASGQPFSQTITGNLTGKGDHQEVYTHYLQDIPLETVLSDSREKKDDFPLLEYNAAGQVILKTDKEGSSESYVWDQHGNLISKTVSSTGKTGHFSYDAMNRLIRDDEDTSYQYDYNSNLIVKTDALGNETRYTFDSLNRMVKMEEAEVITQSGEWVRPTTLYVYNELDQTVKMTDPDGWTTEKAYNVRGDSVKIIYADGTEETAYYELDGTPVHLSQDPPREDNKQEFEKELDEEKTEKPPEASAPGDPEDLIVKTIIINDHGQSVVQKSFIDFAGIKTILTLDALGRTVQIEKLDLNGEPFLNSSFIYSPGGQKVSETTNGLISEWSWGPMGNLKSYTELAGTDKERKTLLKHDKQGRLTEIIKPNGIALSYGYDEKNGLISIASSDGSINYAFKWNSEGRLEEAEDLLNHTSTFRKYDEAGNIQEETLANGLTVKWETDAFVLPDQTRIRYKKEEGTLHSITREDASGTPLYIHAYSSFDAYGDLCSEELIFNLGAVNYRYDEERRAISIKSDYREELLVYDGIKLVEIEANGERKTFEYDSQFRCIPSKKPPQTDEVEDQLGQIIHNGTHAFKYDPLGRLTDVDGEWFYSYDAFGRRISKTDNAGNKTLYLWDSMEEIGAYDEKGFLKELKILGAYGPVAIEINEQVFAPLKDAKGSIVGLISQCGQIEDASSLSPWGYTSKRHDTESGLIYFGARYLDPVKGEFITPDPKGSIDGPHDRLFARGNSMAYRDHWGHFSLWEGFKSLVSAGWNALVSLQQKICDFRAWVDSLNGSEWFSNQAEETALKLLGKGFLINLGFYNHESAEGTWGDYEINPKVRITFINGITNILPGFTLNLDQIKNYHGGTKIHFVFRPTRGFAKDVLKSVAGRFGYVSPEAHKLVQIWRRMIEEMGGVEGGGKIIHYAHSAGGIDTKGALSQLTPEEQRMLDIKTFGSAYLIPDIGTYKAVNYVSKTDGVSSLDFFNYISTRWSNHTNYIYIGSAWNVPLVDHPLARETYQKILRALGQAFLESYSPK